MGWLMVCSNTWEKSHNNKDSSAQCGQCLHYLLSKNEKVVWLWYFLMIFTFFFMPMERVHSVSSNSRYRAPLLGRSDVGYNESPFKRYGSIST